MEVSLIRYFTIFSNWIVKNINTGHRFRLKRGYIQRATEILLAHQFSLHTFKARVPFLGFFYYYSCQISSTHWNATVPYNFSERQFVWHFRQTSNTTKCTLLYGEKNILWTRQHRTYTAWLVAKPIFITYFWSFHSLHFILSLLFHIYNLHFITK